MKIIRFSVAGVIAASLFLLLNDLFRAKINTPAVSGKSECRSEALDALQWLSKTRAYPDADIPSDAYANAFAWQQARMGDPQTAATGSWTSIGPNNLGGRTLSMALDPNDTNTIWLGSASGGLWKSTTGGMGTNAWSYVPTGFPVLGVAAIAINPSNPNEMYIGTGEGYNQGTASNGLSDRTTRGTYGMGILKSTDGGNTWSYALNWSYQQQRTVWDIVINPLRPATVFAATSEGVYRSTDAGANWTQVLNVPMCMDIAMHETDTTVLLTGAGNINSANKGLYRSADGGLSWALAGNGFPNSNYHGRITIEMYSDNNDIIMAQLCDIYNTVGFYRSMDKGLNWTLVSGHDVCSYQGWYCAGMAFKPGSPNEFLAGGVDMFYSTNGGSNFSTLYSWVTGMHSDVHAIEVNPQHPNSIYIATDGGLYRSWNFGVSCFDCNDGYVSSQAYIGSVSQTDPNYALSGFQDNNSLMYSGTPYWTGVYGGDGCYNLIDPVNDDNAFVAYQYLNVIFTPDHWNNSWQVISTPSNPQGNNPAAFLAPFVYSPGNTQRMYAGENDLLRSDDGGASWSVFSPSPIDSGNVIMTIGVSYTHEDSLYVATSPDFGRAKFMISTDGGASFTDRSTGLPDRFPRRIAVDPRNSRIVYVVYSGFGTGHVFKTTDAGMSWTDISVSLPDVPFHCVFLDPMYPDIVYAGSDMGLYASTDGGASWFSHNTGLPDWTMVFDLAASQFDRSVLCFTHGHGVWKRSLDDITGLNAANAEEFSVKLFPNPAVDFTQVHVSGISGKMQISVFDYQGKQVHRSQVQVAEAGTDIRIPVAEWSAGVYFVSLEAEGKKVVRRLLVE